MREVGKTENKMMYILQSKVAFYRQVSYIKLGANGYIHYFSHEILNKLLRIAKQYWN